MLTREFLSELSKNVGRAERVYHLAVAENLKEAGRPVRVQDSSYADNEGVNISVEHDGSLFPWTVDLIKWDAEKSEVMVHCTSMDYSDTDCWQYLTELGDATDYVLDNIDWDDVTDNSK